MENFILLCMPIYGIYVGIYIYVPYVRSPGVHGRFKNGNAYLGKQAMEVAGLGL